MYEAPVIYTYMCNMVRVGRSTGSHAGYRWYRSATLDAGGTRWYRYPMLGAGGTAVPCWVSVVPGGTAMPRWVSVVPGRSVLRPVRFRQLQRERQRMGQLGPTATQSQEKQVNRPSSPATNGGCIAQCSRILGTWFFDGTCCGGLFLTS